MAIAQHNTATSLTINIQDTHSVNQDILWKAIARGTLQIKRLWWHTKAYGVILSVMLLTLVSVIFLGIHWSYRKLLWQGTESRKDQA